MEPSRRHTIFYATELTAEAARRGSDVRRLIELVTGMPTIVGTDIQARDLQSAIMQAIDERLPRDRRHHRQRARPVQSRCLH